MWHDATVALTLECLCTMRSFLEARVDSQDCDDVEAGDGGPRCLFEKPGYPDFSELWLFPYSSLS